MSDWQAITSSDPPAFVDGRQRMVVIYTDGTRKIPKTFYAADADDLARQAKAFVTLITEVVSATKPIQPNTVIDLTPDPPPVVPTPTAAEIHRAAIVSALRDVRCAINAVTVGVGTQKDVDAACAIVQALYVAETDRLLLGGVI